MNKGRLPNIGRVVYRSNNNANPNGGVANANANNDSANVNANIGSRLANNKIKRLASKILGVQHRGRVLNVVPMGRSLSNSVGLDRWKAEKSRAGAVRLVGAAKPSAEDVKLREIEGYF